MTKDVGIKIKTVIKAEQGQEEMLSTFKGTFYEKNSSAYVLYEDENEEGQISKCMLKINSDMLEMKKQGDCNARMTFCEGRVIESVYNTPYGNMGFNVSTQKMIVKKSEDKIRVEIAYTLLSGESVVSSHDMSIEITSIY